MFETFVTVVGNIATTPKGMKLKSGDTVLNFRIASNERRRNGPGGEWGPGDSLFLGVTCWRQLAENVLASFTVGDPVIVRGRLYTDEYKWDGEVRVETRLDAITVGADLARCTAQITRNRRRTEVVAQGALETEESTSTAPVGERSWPSGDEAAEAAGAPNGFDVEPTDDDGPTDGDGPTDDELQRLVAGAEAAVGA